MVEQRKITLAVTDAGGTRIARSVLEALIADDQVRLVDLMASASGRKLIAYETGRDAAVVEIPE